MSTQVLFTVNETYDFSTSGSSSEGTSSSSSPSPTIAVFLIVTSSFPSGKTFAVTTNATVAVPLFAGTFTVIPFAKSSAVLVASTTPFISIVPALKVVPSGIVSFTTVLPAVFPVFVKVILYLISSFSLTCSLSACFSAVIFTV